MLAPDDQHADPRARRTRGWIIDAFNALFFRKPYDSINVAQIAGAAGVGRSTFYEHFKGKDAVLRRAASVHLAVLADAALSPAPPDLVDRIAWVLEHFRDNRATAIAILNGPSGPQIARELAGLIEARLAEIVRARNLTPLIPLPLAANQAAGAQLALILDWLEHSIEPCSSSALADAIRRTTAASMNALLN